MFENLGFSELLLIMVIALVVFGPSKLPELGKSLGSAMREFKKATRALTEEVQKAATVDLDPPARPAAPAPAAPAPPAAAEPPAPVPAAPAGASDTPAPGTEPAAPATGQPPQTKPAG